jgi:hypothetical protein
MAQTTLNGLFVLIFVISMFRPFSSLLALWYCQNHQGPEKCVSSPFCVV